MVGLCGVVSNHDYDIDEMLQKLIYLGDERSHDFSDNHAKIGSVFFKRSQEKQPVSTQDGSLIWVWGEIYGFKSINGYYSKDRTDISNGEYCGELYDEHGIDFISGLNGEFAGILYDREDEMILLFTDRLGTHPIFFTKTEDNELIFSTQIQSIPLYPSVNTEFDLNYVRQFFTFERVLGNKTVLKGVEQVHPGSVLTYDLKSDKFDNKIYWYPKYEPRDRSYSNVVEEFTELFKNVIKERVRKDLTYGLYLSGGSDSRLILGAIKDVYPDLEVKCYHMNEFMNREAKVAKKVADVCDCEFKLLKREDDYQKTVLEESSKISIFNSWFDQCHSIGFKDIVKDEVDAILNGSYAGTIMGGGHVPLESTTIPIVNENVYLPFFKKPDSLDEFVELYSSGNGPLSRDGKIPDYIKANKNDIINSLRSEIKEEGNFVSNHGVKYPSIDGLLQTLSFYPLTNEQSYLVYYADNQSITSCYPFLDRRILDFTQSLPNKPIWRRHIVDASINRINTELAEIKHAQKGISPSNPKSFHFIKKQISMAKSKLFPSERKKGPWGDTAEVIRKTNFVKDKIEKKEDLIRNCNFLDLDKVNKCYLEHIKGKDNTNQLFALLTFIENPITQYLIET